MKIPNQYLQDLSKQSAVYESVEKTHAGCGKLVLMEIQSDVCNKALMVIASPGTGKSASMNAVAEHCRRSRLRLDAITVSGLKHLQKSITGRNMSLFIDDLSKGLGIYSQVATVTTLGELCYTGYIKKFTVNMKLDIKDFRGSAIFNAQPLILRNVLRATEYETDIRDKVVRFYHLARPVNVHRMSPEFALDWGYDYAKVLISDQLSESKIFKAGLRQFRYEFGKGRAEEHYTAYVQASASIEGRTTATEADCWLVNELTRGFLLEAELFSKHDLEGERKLDVNILPIISVLRTFGQYAVEDMMVDYQVRRGRMYEIMEENDRYVTIVKKKDGKYIIPTVAGKRLLEDIGEL